MIANMLMLMLMSILVLELKAKFKMHFILSISSQLKHLICTFKNCISGKISYHQKLTCQIIYSFLGADEKAETKRLEIKRKINEKNADLCKQKS